ncbi:MAG: PspA/IM30 family protein [Lachnospiraceae bacterium]|nr:PspA/IM30 family protein [Lachnospiraceae bacterium]
MGIIKRFTDIMSANINALLDKAEDPEKMIDQYLRDLESDLGNVKAETAAVMAEEQKAKRQLDECDEEIAKLQSYAERAVLAGKDDDAKAFLRQKNASTEKRAALEQAYTLAAANATKMRQMHDKLVGDIASLNARRDAIKAKMKAAKAQEKINKIGSSMSGVAANMSAFDKMEEKANQMLDKANAMAELNGAAAVAEEGIESLMAQYDAQPSAVDEVDDELAALKAALGK